MTGPTAITETCAELEALLTKATKGPWAYHPTVYDDWGWIRGTEIDGKMGRYQPVVAHARNSEVTSDQEGAHRLAGTDPYGPNAELITAAVNALPTLIATIRHLPEERDAFRTQAINRGWNWKLCDAYGREEYERQLAKEVDRTLEIMLGRKTLAESFRDEPAAAALNSGEG